MGITTVRRALDAIGLVPSRRLGQSFLINDGIAARIASACTGRSILEIGPGLGALTGHLLVQDRTVTAVEVSHRLADWLEVSYAGRSLNLVRGDFLEVNPALLPGAPFDCIAANLPYSISSQALFRLTDQVYSSVQRAVVMLQTELAARITSSPGCKEYGRLALGIWPVFETKVLLDAEPCDFYPEPAVNSRVLVLERRREPLVPESLMTAFRRVVGVSFASRRKTILNNLSAVFGRERAASLLEQAGIDSGQRAEQLARECFKRIAELVET